jgi:hypothetical protein
MGLFVRTCTAMGLKGFEPQHLANTINGEGVIHVWACVNGS